jgi:hypothetical protein
VNSASVINSAPFGRMFIRDEFGIEGQPTPNFDAGQPKIDADYFKTMGIPLLAGREFTSRDTGEAPKVAIVSERIVREYFPGPGEALGRRVRRAGSHAAIRPTAISSNVTIVNAIGSVGVTPSVRLRRVGARGVGHHRLRPASLRLKCANRSEGREPRILQKDSPADRFLAHRAILRSGTVIRCPSLGAVRACRSRNKQPVGYSCGHHVEGGRH